MKLNLTRSELCKMEKDSIIKFVDDNKSYLTGRVLDYGCFKQPYRDLVSGEYCPYNRKDNYIPEGIGTIEGTYDAILCNQVIQYVSDIDELFSLFYKLLNNGGVAIITYPTNWDEVEALDLCRFTKKGIELFVKTIGFKIIEHKLRWKLEFKDFNMNGGYGIIIKKI